MTQAGRAAAGQPVAIVGIGCRFPGGVTDPASFWRLLEAGADAIVEIPQDRIDLSHYFDARPATPGRIMTRWGGFLDGLEQFDAEFFGISPLEAERLDPQQRLLLETTWEAFEDAGIDTGALLGRRGGVFVGQWLSDFEGRLFAEPEGVDFYMTTGSGRYATSGRLSYVFGLHGPSLTIDTACSSSLAAVHLAVRSIRSAESEFAIAGGTNVILQPHISVAYSQSRMMAPDGHCKFGDAQGDGYVRSEGAAVVVLKPLDRALADGDRIYAVIRGSAVNNDGRGSGSMGTPSRAGQEDLLHQAYRDAGVAPGRVGYVEAHGTGTRAGDPVELGALGAVLSEGRGAGPRARVGSVKTNIGHTEGAAGVAGLVKAALSLHHGAIPASLHCHEPNPTIPWADIPVEIARQKTPWPGGGETRIAGVSAFGIAGTNAHVVLEEAPPIAVRDAPTDDIALLVLSARQPHALRELAARYAQLLKSDSAPGLGAVCAGAAMRRTPLEHRAAFVATDRATLAAALSIYAAGDAATAEGSVYADRPARLVFVFPGQGAQWVGMGRELLAREPVFRAALERCDAAASAWLDTSIVAQLLADPDAPNFRMARIEVIQPVLVALAIAYAELLKSWGVVPDAVVGHSMGEVGAAHVAGVIGLDEAMRIICRRSALMGRTSGRGAMAMVDLSMADTERRLSGREHQVSVAASNSPRASVVSGDVTAVHELLTELEADGVFCRQVKVDVASHSPQMEVPAGELVREMAGLKPAAGSVPILSTVLGRHAQGGEFDAAYWGRNMRQPVRFAECVGAALDDGASVFIELGPHPVLTAAIQQTVQLRDAAASAVACGRREEPEAAGIRSVAAQAWVAGRRLAWPALLESPAQPVDLPSYPWQRERHWVRAARPVDARRQAAPTIGWDNRMQEWLRALRWVRAEPVAAGAAAGRGEWLVVTERAAWGQALVERLNAASHTASLVVPDQLEIALRAAAGRAALRGVLVCTESTAAARYTPIAALQALARHAQAAGGGPRLWFATFGAQAVPGHERARVAVDAAAAWGAGRVIAEEHPEFWGGLVDLDPAAGDAANADWLAGELLGAGGDSQVAWRSGERFTLRLQNLGAEAAEPQPMAWRPDAAYLLTGGLGGVGLHVAATMVAQGARRLVMLGRSALPERSQWADVPAGSLPGQRIAAIRALESAGASVHLMQADVADAHSLELALQRYTAEAWPPIRGVIHAAGTTENHLALQTDPQAFARVVAPKLDGALHLDRLLPELDAFILFSSVSATIGWPGMANYAAANAGLDALASDRRARGLHGLSIQWGPWEDTGLHAGEVARQQTAELLRQGVQTFSAAQGQAVFGALAGRTDASVTVMPADWAMFQTARRGRDLRLYADLVPSAGADAADGLRLSERLAALGHPGERRKLLEPSVRDAVGRVLKLAPARLDPRKPLGSMGLSSLLAMELRNRLEAALDRPLSATLAWNYPTVDALVAFLAGDAEVTPAAPVAAPAVPHAPAAIDAVAEMSDEDAARLLRRR